MWGPVIVGSLVTLAPVEPEHLPNWVRWSRDPRGMRYLGIVRPMTMADEEQWYQRMTTSETDVVWALLREGQHIGSTALHAIDWRNRHAVSGIWIGEVSQHGKGCGGEAMRLRTAHAFNELGLEKVTTEILAENEASRRAAERAGYRQCGLRRRHVFRHGRWLDQWLGEVLRDEWLASQVAQ